MTCLRLAVPPHALLLLVHCRFWLPCRVVSQQAHLDAVITVLETSTYTLMNVSNEFRHGKTLVVLGRVVADVLDVTVAQMRARLDDATALAR